VEEFLEEGFAVVYEAADDLHGGGLLMGGISVVSFAVKAPPALKAVIGISISWPAALFSDCKKAGFVPFGDLGTEVPVPMLWIYAKNEHWPLPSAKSEVQFHEAFISAGGNAELAMVDRSGENGYFLFRDSPQLWARSLNGTSLRMVSPLVFFILIQQLLRRNCPQGFQIVRKRHMQTTRNEGRSKHLRLDREDHGVIQPVGERRNLPTKRP
jgi:hypothetical protein